MRIRVCPAAVFENDLHDDRRQHDPSMDPRDDRTERRGAEDVDEGFEVGGRNRLADDRRDSGVHDQARRAQILGTMPQLLVVDSPGSSLIRPSPLRKAFGAQVMGSTARLRLATSGSGSPVNSIK